MKNANSDIRRALYEAPGPRARRRIVIATVLSLAAIAVLAALILRRFYVTGQLDRRYWSLFTSASTWRFLGEGLWGTLKAAAAAGAVAYLFGLALMLLRLSGTRALRWIGAALTELSRGIPTLLFIYFFLPRRPEVWAEAADLLEDSPPGRHLRIRHRCGGAALGRKRRAKGTD